MSVPAAVGSGGGGPRSARSIAGHALLVAIAYYACAHLGSFLSLRDSAYVTFWLPSGVFIAVLLLEPPRVWPWSERRSGCRI
jgi:integral membrane sensor domain MASE1